MKGHPWMRKALCLALAALMLSGRAFALDYEPLGEAEAAMAELRHAFPSMAAYMRIVRDKINTFD